MTYLLSINPYLGPLQIALGKMIIDIVKWMFLFLLVVFAFGCGMTQLLSYYADLEMKVCYRYQHNKQLKPFVENGLRIGKSEPPSLSKENNKRSNLATACRIQLAP